MTVIELMTALLVFSLVMGAVSSLLISSLAGVLEGQRGHAGPGQRDASRSAASCARCARRAGFIDGAPESRERRGRSRSIRRATLTPQLSFALPHTAVYTLSDGTTAYATDANASGANPYDGWYVSYYLSSAQAAAAGALAPAADTSGPYVIRVQYDVTVGQLSYGTVAGGVTALTLAARGTCPTVERANPPSR